MINAVCSHKRHASVQRGAKGSQWWARDVYHITGAAGKTLCGLNCSEWLTIGKIAIDSNCCKRCSRMRGEK